MFHLFIKLQRMRGQGILSNHHDRSSGNSLPVFLQKTKLLLYSLELRISLTAVSTLNPVDRRQGNSVPVRNHLQLFLFLRHCNFHETHFSFVIYYK